MLPKKLIKVRHGLPGMSERIPPDQAERFVRRGMAEWTSAARKKIRFIPSHQRDTAETQALARQSAEDRYYNGNDALTRAQLRGLPLLMPDKALVNPKKMRSAVHRNGKVKRIVVDGIEMKTTMQQASREII